MKINSYKKQQLILQQLEKFKNDLIIVEGKKDKQALENLGFSNIFILNRGGKSIKENIEKIEQLAKGQIIILTDFDKKGKQLFKLLKSELSQRKVKINNSFRKKISNLDISHIEGLDSLINNKNIF